VNLRFRFTPCALKPQGSLAQNLPFWPGTSHLFLLQAPESVSQCVSVSLSVLLTCASAAEWLPQVITPHPPPPQSNGCCCPSLFNSSDSSRASLSGAVCLATPSRRHSCNMHSTLRLSVCLRYFPDLTAGFWKSRLRCDHCVYTF